MLLHLTALCFFWFLCSLEANEGFHQDFKFWVLVDWLCPHNCSEDVLLRGRQLKQCTVIHRTDLLRHLLLLQPSFAFYIFLGLFGSGWEAFMVSHPLGVSRASLGQQLCLV